MSDIESISSSSDSETDDEIYVAKSKKKPVKFMENDEDDDAASDMSREEKNEDDSDEDSKADSDDEDVSDEGEEDYAENEEEARKTLNKSLGKEDDSDDDDYESDEDDENEDEYFRKFDEKLKTNVISEYHPEMLQHNYEEIDTLTVIRYENGVINDPLHKTVPILTKYEKARILGERAKQINSGAKPFVAVDETVIDGYLIALKELEEKKIPFIIRRPLPNGGCEYWKLKDLEII